MRLFLALCLLASPAAAQDVRVLNYDAAGCSVGSGTLVDVRNGRGLVVSCDHLFSDGVGRVVVQFADGRSHGALVVARDGGADLSALEIADPRATPSGVDFDVSAGEPLTLRGFGGDGAFREFTGAVTGTSVGAGGQQNVDVAGLNRHGDSGGGVFDARGRLVGVQWGNDGVGATTCTTGEPFRRFVTGCYGGRCTPWPGTVVRPAVLPGVRIVGPSPAAPAPKPAAAACDCKTRLDTLAAKVAAIESSRPAQGPRGPSGPPGPAGPAADIDLDTLATTLAARLNESSPAPPAEPAGREIKYFDIVPR